MREPPVKKGDVLAGKYRVDSVLGVGGMGVVVAATHLELHELRAIKLMLPEALESPEWVERFLREARAAARLRSEHVARVHDVGRLDDGAPFLVMEYLAGSDLRGVLRERGHVPVAEAVGWALQACEALAEAHAAGIVHRDLKLANLFLTTRRDGSTSLKVLDFGISKVRGQDDPEMTSTQAVLGSPTYMSPEQMRSARSVDPRSDVWSLGVILYRLVTGEPPFRAGNLTELVALVLSTRPAPPSTLVPGVPAGFDDVLARCLERDVERRFASVAELAAALAPYASGVDGGACASLCARILSVPLPEPRPRDTGRGRPAPRWAAATRAEDDRALRRWALGAAAALGLAAASVCATVVALSTRALDHRAGLAHEAREDGGAPTAAVVPAGLVAPSPPPAPPSPPSATAGPAPPATRPASLPRRPRPAPAPAPTASTTPPPTAPNRLFGVE